jgi:hypothetical protein
VECKTTGRSRHLADDGRHFTDRAVRFAGIVVGIVNAAPVVIFSVAQHRWDGSAMSRQVYGSQASHRVSEPVSISMTSPIDSDR